MINTLLLSEDNIKSVFCDDLSVGIELVEKAMIARNNNEVILPDKISQIFDVETQNRINCMPATLPYDSVCGVKWVSVFPNNALEGIRNVSGTIVLSELEHGFTKSIMDGTYLTNLRTASVGATAAKYLSKDDSTSIGFIGAGREARMHLDMIKQVRPNLSKCYVSSRREATVSAFIEEEKLKHPNIEFVHCGNDFEKATKGTDIIVTATSAQAPLLKAEWIKEGSLYIHVGGWEDEYAVVQRADKIVCDEWESIKHRTQTLSRMYKEQLLKDEDIYSNLDEIIVGNVPAREGDEFIYFCSVGLAFIDITFANYTYNKCKEQGIGTEFIF